VALALALRAIAVPAIAVVAVLLGLAS